MTTNNPTKSPLFRFTGRFVTSDPSGYVVTDWGGARSVTALAENWEEAIEKIRAALGPPPREKKWSITFDSIDEVPREDQ